MANEDWMSKAEESVEKTAFDCASYVLDFDRKKLVEAQATFDRSLEKMKEKHEAWTVVYLEAKARDEAEKRAQR